MTLSEILIFSTGADEERPLGYSHNPVLNFNNDNYYPTASTCAIQLTLPTRFCDYPSFKSSLDHAFLNHGGFGLS